jgi:hypothetical protein
MKYSELKRRVKILRKYGYYKIPSFPYWEKNFVIYHKNNDLMEYNAFHIRQKLHNDEVLYFNYLSKSLDFLEEKNNNKLKNALNNK